MDSEQQQDQELSRWQQFGAWIEELRAKRGLKQSEAAAQAGMSAEALKVLEHGGFRRHTDGPWILPNPKDSVLYGVARTYGVDAEELFERVGHYADRPQTKRSGRRQPRSTAASQDRLDELEARIRALEAELVRMQERNAETERRLRDAGISIPDEAERPRRRRVPG
jgi:transcriptional regulator with XRE-family HTH domain